MSEPHDVSHHAALCYLFSCDWPSSDKRISDRCRVRYLCAIAPTSNTTKLVATAIATFVSTDKFINPPFRYGGPLYDPSFEIIPFEIASNLNALMDAKTES